ncbi:hypothetical protein BH23GEM7_BH23GEM7_12200 [soil metagenome]
MILREQSSLFSYLYGQVTFVRTARICRKWSTIYRVP